jgi:hypothetical protein
MTHLCAAPHKLEIPIIPVFAVWVIEETVEGFVEDCLDRVRPSADDFKNG